MGEHKWHSGRILLACATHFNWFQNKMATEYYVDGGLADLVFISRAGYLTEIEIKTSLRDWEADQKKWKWKRKEGRPHVSRFFYAIPETLEGNIPEWVPAEAGIIVVYHDGYGVDRCRIVREAKRFKASKIDDAAFEAINRSCYYRFWRREISGLHHRFCAEHNTDKPSGEM